MILQLCTLHRLRKHLGETLAIENVVAKHEAYIIAANELLTDYERLRKAVGVRLLGKCEINTPLLPGAQELLERWQIVWG